jgi:hypothetical protein
VRTAGKELQALRGTESRVYSHRKGKKETPGQEVRALSQCTRCNKLIKARTDYVAAIEDRIRRMEVVINAAGLVAEPGESESLVDEIEGQAGLSDRMSTLVMGEEGIYQFIGEANAACRSTCVNVMQEHRRRSLSFLCAVCSGPRSIVEAMTPTDYSEPLQMDTDLGWTSPRIYGDLGQTRSRHRFPPRTWLMITSMVN